MKRMKLRVSQVAAAGVAALLVALIAGCDAANPGTARGKAEGGIAWTEDVATALQESARTGKPVMLDFFATWCMPCKVMDKQTYPDPAVIAEAQNWIAVRVDVDRNSSLAERYRIQAVPTLVFIRTDGREVTRLDGFVSASELSRAMENIRQQLDAAKPNKETSI